MRFTIGSKMEACDTDSDIKDLAKMLRGISRVVPALRGNHDQGRLFWWALTILRGGYPHLYAGAARLMLACIRHCGHNDLPAFLLQQRAPESDKDKLDETCRTFDQRPSIAHLPLNPLTVLQGTVCTILQCDMDAKVGDLVAGDLLLTLLRAGIHSGRASLGANAYSGSHDEMLPLFLATIPYPRVHAQCRDALEKAGIDRVQFGPVAEESGASLVTFTLGHTRTEIIQTGKEGVRQVLLILGEVRCLVPLNHLNP